MQERPNKSCPTTRSHTHPNTPVSVAPHQRIIAENHQSQRIFTPSPPSPPLQWTSKGKSPISTSHLKFLIINIVLPGCDVSDVEPFLHTPVEDFVRHKVLASWTCDVQMPFFKKCVKNEHPSRGFGLGRGREPRLSQLRVGNRH